MNGLRKAVVAILASLVAVFVAAGSASAITVTNEDESPSQGIPCGSVTVNGHSVTQSGEDCLLHIVSREPIDLEVFGVTVSTCNDEFRARVGANGLGAVIGQLLIDVTAGSCIATPCNENGSNDPWPIVSQTERDPDGHWTMRLALCLDVASFGNVTCVVELPYVVTGHNLAVFGTTGQEHTCLTPFGVQLHGSWTTTSSDDDIEIRH